ncbi:alpha/beta hydrolase [Spongiibacter sp. KMU-158]|uniref:Alpha/beta hydrolase n=1 Tax=Spongiibacter pelagi TaxID=2760804 RepID=A0A927GY98_9GAMM|nr:alpha/beta hydrolase [Spongiibacter pelagi]MBD2860224.1 alpha/beta hydrolase [Spongiibacter pelagi]
MPHITTLSGVKIFYESHGSGEPVVLLHGLGGSSRDWAPQTGHLSKNYRVISIDMRGHGQSDSPDSDYDMEIIAQETHEVLSALSITSAHIIGISMGGMLAFEVAIQNPELAKSLVIVNSGPTMQIKSFRFWLKKQTRRALALIAPKSLMSKVIANNLFPEPNMEDQRQYFINQVALMNPKTYRKALSAALSFNQEDASTTLLMPILFITGEFDYTTPEEKRPFVDKIPHATMEIIANARHALPIERPDIFNKTVDNFLSSIA